MDPDGSMASTLAHYSIGAGPVGVHWSRNTDSGQLQDCNRAPFKPAIARGRPCSTSQARPPRERITIPRIPILKPSLEPTDSLRRRPVRERIRVGMSGRLLLDPIVSHGRRRVQTGLDIARLKDVFLPRLVRPNAGVAVGLQLELH